MKGGKRNLPGSLVKSEIEEEQGAANKARRIDEPHAKKPMPDIIRKGLFTAAVKEQCVDSISRWCGLYENFVDMADSSDRNCSFIWKVVTSDNLPVLKMLVDEQGLDLNHFTVYENENICLVTAAVAYDSEKCLTFLQSKGATMEFMIKHGCSLVHVAVLNSALNSLKSIASWGEHLFRKRDNFGFSPMDYASKKKGGSDYFIQLQEKLDDRAMQCVLFLAGHIDKEDAKTALRPFSKLYKDSSLLKKIKEIFRTYTQSGYISTYGVEMLLKTSMIRAGYHDVACFLIEADVKMQSKEENEKLYHDALKKGAPDSIIQMMETRWFGA